MGAKTLLTTIAVVSMLLTACTSADAGISASGEASPTASETLTPPSPTPTPSPSLTPLTDEELEAALPDEVFYESLPAAIAFANFFIKESYAILQSRDPRVYEAVSRDSCTFCRSSLEYLNVVEDNQYDVQGATVTTDLTRSTGGLQNDDKWWVTIPIELAATKLYDAEGALLETHDTEAVTVTFVLEYEDPFWSAVEVGVSDS
ncbi:DUF6318 family protein [Demequina sediminicola]|uniref:DUF6318 family protein n=1 Tax=Demequina sediminicola TaxID=1095026 RepID=UPI000782222F|nr:DUF6318 family protein [Demequina sediminicola]